MQYASGLTNQRYYHAECALRLVQECFVSTHLFGPLGLSCNFGSHYFPPKCVHDLWIDLLALQNLVRVFIDLTNKCVLFLKHYAFFRCLKRKLASHFDEDELLKLITEGRSYSEWLLLTKLSKVRLKHEFCIELEIDEIVPLFSLCRQCTTITLSWWWKK